MLLIREFAIFWIALIAGFVALAVWWELPKALLWRRRSGVTDEDWHHLERQVRGDVGKVVAGALALAGFCLTFQEWKTGRDESRRDYLAREYSTGFTLLGTQNEFAKVGGIYKLEEIAQGNHEYQEAVRQALGSYIRTGAATETKTGFPSADVQAALTVISRRGSRIPAERIRLDGVNLAHANVSRGDLSGFSLKGATLSYLDGWCVNLYKAELYGAKLAEANLPGADLSEAYLCDGFDSLDGASLDGAELTSARFFGACIRNASFKGATLAGSNFRGVRNFSGTDFSCSRPGKCTNAWMADFRGTRLEGAKFSGTRVACADFRDADLTMATWHMIEDEDSAFYCNTKMPNGKVRNDDCSPALERAKKQEQLCGYSLPPSSDEPEACH